MPLLYKKPFERIEEPADLSDSEEVFYCELTDEIFRDYEWVPYTSVCFCCFCLVGCCNTYSQTVALVCCIVEY